MDGLRAEELQSGSGVMGTGKSATTRSWTGRKSLLNLAFASASATPQVTGLSGNSLRALSSTLLLYHCLLLVFNASSFGINNSTNNTSSQCLGSRVRSQYLRFFLRPLPDPKSLLERHSPAVCCQSTSTERRPPPTLEAILPFVPFGQFFPSPFSFLLLQ